MITNEKRLIDGLYNIILCQRNLHYVFEIPKPQNIEVTPDEYVCNLPIHDMPSDKYDSIRLFIGELFKYQVTLKGLEGKFRKEQLRVLFDLINSSVNNMIDYYKGLLYDED